MSFSWPWLLLLLFLVPALIALYLWVLRRKRKAAIRYSSLALIRAALPERTRWLQHLPFALYLLGMISLIAAVARPSAAVEVPLSRTTIILALDVSRSMCATDVPPNRLTVAQEAVTAFIDNQAPGTRIGIVAFAGFAELVVPPTDDKERLRAAVESFTTSLGTAIGSAALKSIDAIAEGNPAVAPSGLDLGLAGEREPAASDGYAADIVVLLTDGANSQGPLPLAAAEAAADRRVRLYTIGFGTDNPQEIVCSRAQLGSDAFAGGFGGTGGGFGGGFGGIRRFLVIDEGTLQAMADMTGGAYYRAEDADQLLDVFLELPTEITLQREQLEISVYFAALGALLALGAVAVSLKLSRFP